MIPTLPLLRRLSQGLAAVCGSLLIAGSVLAEGASRTPESPARGVLWEVVQGGKTAYLFGSVHLAKKSFYPFPEAVQQAYQQADTLAVEVDSSDAQANLKAMPLLMYSGGDKLENHLHKSTWEDLRKTVGAASAQFQPLKPAIVATGLMMGVFSQLGYDPRLGVDLHFIERAKKDKKTVVELESMEFQAQVLGGLSDEEGDAMLAQTLSAMKNGEALRDTQFMIDAWKRGDAETLASIMEDIANKDEGSRKTMKALLDDRNLPMVEKILSMMDSGKRLFIVVGAGHLSGKNSLTDLLRQRGVQVRQIK